MPWELTEEYLIKYKNLSINRKFHYCDVQKLFLSKKYTSFARYIIVLHQNKNISSC